MSSEMHSACIPGLSGQLQWWNPSSQVHHATGLYQAGQRYTTEPQQQTNLRWFPGSNDSFLAVQAAIVLVDWSL